MAVDPHALTFVERRALFDKFNAQGGRSCSKISCQNELRASTAEIPEANPQSSSRNEIVCKSAVLWEASKPELSEIDLETHRVTHERDENGNAAELKRQPPPKKLDLLDHRDEVDPEPPPDSPKTPATKETPDSPQSIAQKERRKRPDPEGQKHKFSKLLAQTELASAEERISLQADRARSMDESKKLKEQFALLNEEVEKLRQRRCGTMPAQIGTKELLTLTVTQSPFGIRINVRTKPKVVEVSPGSFAEAVGVKKGFVLVKVGDKKVTSLDWADAYREAKPPFDITFDTSPVTDFLEITQQLIGDLPDGNPLGENFESFTCHVHRLPFGLDICQQRSTWACVERVLPGSPADEVGVMHSDVLVVVEDKHVRSDNWLSALKQHYHEIPFKLHFRRLRKSRLTPSVH